MLCLCGFELYSRWVPLKTGLSVYFIRLAIWQVKKSFSIYRLQVMGLQINLSGECDA